MSAHVFTNWSGLHRCEPARRRQPRDEAEVIEVILEARRRGQVVRVVGAGHSWSDAVCTDGVLINLDRMDRTLEIDASACTVRVQAGLRLKVLNARLAQAGLAMSNLGSISEQSVAGAIATGTHGSGAAFGNLSTMVKRLRLITAEGRALDLDADSGDIFRAACLSLGALGVVTEVTLQCEPAFHLHERAFGMGFEEACEAMDALVDAHEHVKLWWLPHTDRVMAYAMNRADRPATIGPGTGGLPRSLVERAIARRSPSSGVKGEGVDLVALADHLVNVHVFDGLLKLGGRHPALIPLVNHGVAAAYFIDRERVGRSDRLFNVPMPPVHREMEYGVPRAKAAQMLRSLRALIERRGLRVNFIVELRFVAADDLLLSPAFGRQSCQLGAYMAQAPDLDAYFKLFEAMALEIDGRPHWGKEFFAPAEALRARLPRLDDFDALRRDLDPDGAFANPFIQRIFAPTP